MFLNGGMGHPALLIVLYILSYKMCNYFYVLITAQRSFNS